MTITAFYDDVRVAIGRGTANDTAFPGWAQEAISLIENEHTYQWMKQTLLFALVAAPDSNQIDLGMSNIKAIDWVKFGTVAGSGATAITTLGNALVGVDPFQITSFDNGYANAFYLSGVSTLVLDALPQEASSLYVAGHFFTQWPTDTSQTPPILMRHYQAFKAIFLMIAAANLRDDRLGGIWTQLGTGGKQAMLTADAELEWRPRRGLRMGGSQ